MKSSGSSGSFLWALLLVLLAFICTGKSYKQELWLYDAQDDAIQIQSNVADTSRFRSFLPYVTRVCARGAWLVYITENFQAQYTWFGSQNSSDIVCENFLLAPAVKSLRHTGANDTDTDSLSLYEGPEYDGKEVFVTDLAYTGITHNISRIAITGTSEWMLFEGQDLDEKSVCFKLPSGYYIYFGAVEFLNLATIGSVFRSCDVQEIKNYKMLHKSSFVNSN